MGIGDGQVHSRQAPNLEAGEELAPELERLRVAHRRTQHLAGALDRHSGRHDKGPGEDMCSQPDFAVGGIEVDVREGGVRQAPFPESGDLVIEAGADPGDLRLRDSRRHAQCGDEVVDTTSGHPVHVGLDDHGVQCLVDPPAVLEQRWEERSGPQRGDLEFDIPGRGRDRLAAVPVAVGGPVLGAFLVVAPREVVNGVAAVNG